MLRVSRQSDLHAHDLHEADMRILAAIMAFGVFAASEYGQLRTSARCQFGAAPKTLSDQFLSCELAIYVQWDGKFDADERPIVRVMNPLTAEVDGAPKRGELITLWKHKPDGRHLLVGGRRRSKTILQPVESWIWDRSQLVNKSVFEYLKEAPSKSDAESHSSYFVRFLEHKDPIIATDAHLEIKTLGSSDLASARSLKAATPTREQLRKWLSDPAVPQRRKEFYALLLGLRGRASDRDFLRSLFRYRSEEYRPELQSALTGYILLTGEPGLKDVSQMIIEPDEGADQHGQLIEISFSEKYAALSAVRALLAESKPCVPKSVLLASIHPLVHDDAIVDLVIPDFARHKDWSRLDTINNVLKKPEIDRPVRLAAIKYMLHLQRDPVASKTLQEKVASYLEIISRDHPTVYESAKRVLIR